MMKGRKFVYICSASHSGSTALSLALGGQLGLAGFGEIAQTVKRMHGRTKPCTCGQLPCPVWGPVLQAVDALPAAAENGRIVAAVSKIAALSADKFAIDSSKNLNTLKLIRERLDLDLHVLHLVRDGRAVARSNLKKDRDLFGSAIAWQKTNRQIERYLSVMPDNRNLRVRYEDFVADPASQLRRILSFLGLPAGDVNLALDASLQHHLRGNRMRYNAAAIVADAGYVDALDDNDWQSLNKALEVSLRHYGYSLEKQAMRAALSQAAQAEKAAAK